MQAVPTCPGPRGKEKLVHRGLNLEPACMKGNPGSNSQLSEAGSRLQVTVELEQVQLGEGLKG